MVGQLTLPYHKMSHVWGKVVHLLSLDFVPGPISPLWANSHFQKQEASLLHIYKKGVNACFISFSCFGHLYISLSV